MQIVNNLSITSKSEFVSSNNSGKKKIDVDDTRLKSSGKYTPAASTYPLGSDLERHEKLKEASREINTVFSVDIINKCRGGRIPFKTVVEEAGFKIRMNGKTNVGLGRPLVE